jgi:hypothetical protein
MNWDLSLPLALGDSHKAGAVTCLRCCDSAEERCEPQDKHFVQSSTPDRSKSRNLSEVGQPPPLHSDYIK